MIKKSALLLRIEAAEKRITQLECKHPLSKRIFNRSLFPWTSFVQRCSVCDVTIEEYFLREKFDEAQVKWHKEIISKLEVKK